MRFKSLFSAVSRYRFRRVLYIAFFWTLIDISVTILNTDRSVDLLALSLLTRSALVFIMSFIMGYLFVFSLRDIFKNKPLLINFFAKTVIVLVAALLMNFLVQFVDKKLIHHESMDGALQNFTKRTFDFYWLFKKTLYWVILFLITQLYLEINDKYSPGVFLDILRGKYLTPKIEDRIVMFIDLKDSTPIAEKLGHQQYFLFIRKFIHHVSVALIEYDGIIYQYVGDEIVVSWMDNEKNIRRCLAAVIESRKNIQKHSEYFRRAFNIIPEFRVGIHVGEVTVGEIGVIKKDLAMSGDTMNTTARIRSACNELNEKFIVSKEFVEKSQLQSFQVQSLGLVELKGKATSIELFSLKI